MERLGTTTDCSPSWRIEPHSHRRFGEVRREKKMATAQLVGCGVPKDCVVDHGVGKVVCVGKSFEYARWQLTLD